MNNYEEDQEQRTGSCGPVPKKRCGGAWLVRQAFGGTRPGRAMDLVSGHTQLSTWIWLLHLPLPHCSPDFVWIVLFPNRENDCGGIAIINPGFQTTSMNSGWRARPSFPNYSENTETGIQGGLVHTAYGGRHRAHLRPSAPHSGMVGTSSPAEPQSHPTSSW